MALSGKYGKVDIPGIAPDEPVFILRAQDVLGATGVRMYQLLAESHGLHVAATVEKQRDSSQKWQENLKMPD